jgi:hypothetical protein
MKAGAKDDLAIVAIHNVDMFRQSEVYFGIKVCPEPVGRNMLPMR